MIYEESQTSAREIYEIMTNPTLSKIHRFTEMAKASENAFQPFALSSHTEKLLSVRAIDNLYEGLAPYRCRYCVPDFDRFMRQGSSFLKLNPPGDIWEAVGNLICLYPHIPGVDGRPVYVGNLDRLLEPFVSDAESARKAIRLLLQYLDRTIGDSLCHANIGPEDSVTGRIILDLTAEMQDVAPSVTLLYDTHTSDDFALHAINTAMRTAKPSFANHRMYASEFENYAVASCYNTLPVCGCGMTLVRVLLGNLVLLSNSKDDFLNRVIPDAVASQAELIDKRIRFIVDDCAFFENTFLYHEGLLKKDDDYMIGMFGFVGLAEAVNHLTGAKALKDRFGNNAAADDLGEEIMDKLHSEMCKQQMKYGRPLLHAQVGLHDDKASSPGGRIPIGDEPDIPAQLANFSRMHKHCVAGCGELLAFEPTARKNPTFLLDILKGAMKQDVRYLSFYANDTDLVRVTGYLVKRSDMEKLGDGQQVLNSTTMFGLGQSRGLHILDRKQRHV